MNVRERTQTRAKFRASAAMVLQLGCWMVCGQAALPPAVLERTNALGCRCVGDSLRLAFGYFPNGNPWSPKYVVFETLLLTTNDVGRRIRVTESDDPDFGPLAEMLTNGQADSLCYRVQDCGCTFLEGSVETNLFAPMPTNYTRVDFAGFRILSFELLLDELSFATQGNWTDTSYHFRILINYEPLGPPSFVAEPGSQTAEEGSNVLFAARVDGSPPLTYQWVLNGSNVLIGGTRSALQLSGVRAANAGAYQVVVTNSFGAVTSAPAMLSVIPPVERSLAAGLLVRADEGWELFLERASRLTPQPDWAPRATIVMPWTGGAVASQWYFETLEPGQRFYRIVGDLARSVDLHLVSAISLSGQVGQSVSIDYINQLGPTDAWVPLENLELTNTSQFYYDTSAIGQPLRLYRLTTTFRNLDFELATGLPGSSDFTNAMPGWTGYRGSNQLSSIIYNNEALDTAGVSILDSGCTVESLTGVLHGRYCVCLYSGFQGPPPNYSFDVPAWIAQTAQIPPGAVSIVLNYKPSRNWGGSDMFVTFKSTGISLRVVSSGLDGSSVLAGDISQFAGQTGELMIMAPPDSSPYHGRNIFMVDYIRFSTSPP